MTQARETAAPLRPFLDWPVVTDPGKWAADVAVLGIQHSEPYAHDPRPNDQARAPDAVRMVSRQFCYGPDQWDFDYGAPLTSALPMRCIDCGNFAWVGGGYDEFAEFVTRSLRQLWRQGAQVFVIGGDHGVTIPVLDALDVIGEPVYILHVDAHLDWRAEVGGVTRGYSSPLRWASTKPWVAGMTQIGMRSTGSARRGEVEDARRYGSRMFTAAEIHAGGMAPVLETIPLNMPVYVTIDADGMDPTEMPAVMAPAPGGLRFEQLAPLLRSVATRQRIVGLDIVEIAPHFDHANAITAITAGRLILNALGASWSAEGAFRSRRATAA